MVVCKDGGAIISHVSYNTASRFSQFLRRDVKRMFAEVVGDKVHATTMEPRLVDSPEMRTSTIVWTLCVVPNVYLVYIKQPLK